MDNAPMDRRFRAEGNEYLFNLQKNDMEKVIPENVKKWMDNLLYEECPRCLFTSEYAKIGETQCNYCDIHDQLENNSRPENLYRDLYKISLAGREKRYDCLIGISGGLDSSLLLYLAVKKWDLRPLVIHFDNGFNNEAAESNMKNLCEKLNVNSITYRLDKHEYTNLNLAFLEAGVPDADIPNDIAMTKLMYETAKQHGIKWILNGHDFRTEGSTPAAWTYMDAEYICDVYEQFTGEELKNYPLLTFWDQIKYAFKGIKQIRPFHYGIDREKFEKEMKEFIGWKDYGGKHAENIYTEYVGAHLLPNKFNIDKRIVYLSAQIRSGKLDKSEAKLILSGKTMFDMNKFTDQDLKARIEVCAMSEKQPRENFKRYNFKSGWKKCAVWALAKMKVVPYTFYVKYCK